VLVELGQISEAAKVLAATLAVSRKANSRYCEAQALRGQARVDAAQCQMEEALEAINQSIALLTELDCRLALGRSLAQRGRLHKSQGNDPDASSDWQKALDLFGQIGAVIDKVQTRQLLG
jgi:tetratricopeptide (TPR) repeat protein